MFNLGLFTQPFMLHAWISGTIVAILSSFIGFFIVMRAASFTAHALPEAGFAGGAGALLLSLNPIWGLAVFAVGGAIMIETLEHKENSDVATALMLITALGLGALFLGLTNQYAEGAYALLFGQIVGVSSDQTIVTAVIAMLCLLFLGFLYRPLMLASISAEMAKTRGIPTRWLETCFLLIIALATAVIVPVVGALLCFCLLIAPNAASIYLTSHPMKVMGCSLLLSLITIWLAIFWGYLTGWPIGFFVAAIGAVFYFLARLFSLLKQK